MIEQINKIAEIWWNWMWPMFWQVSVLISFIALIDFVIRKHVWPQVRYALWLLVLVKLLLPPSFALPTGVVSHIQSLVERSVRQPAALDGALPYPLIDENMTPDEPSMARLSHAPMLMEQTVGSEAVESPVLVETSIRTENSGQPSFSGHAIAMIAWMVTTLLLMLRLLGRHRALGRLHYVKDCGRDLPRWLPQLLDDTAEKLHLRQVPQVILSSTVNCPAVLGIFRPVLLLPARSIERLPRQEVGHILLHELAHIKRGDLPVHALSVLLQIFYWFNPLLYPVRRRLQRLRELCCDATVAGILRDKTEAYSQTILQTVERLVNEPRYHGIGLLGLIEDPHHLRVRLEWLKRKPSRHPNLRIATVFILVVAVFAFILPMAKSRSDEEKERANDESLSGQSERVVSFPDNRSIGTLKLRDWDAFDVHISEWEEWREAAGRVTVPEGKALGLFLSMEACSDLSVLESLGGDDLQLLNLPFVQLDAEEMEHLAGLTGLQELRLNGVEFNDSNAALARIKRLPSLRRLSLMHHALTERGLAHVAEISSLEDLILYNATVDDEGLAHLKELKALRGLDLTETSISDEGLAYLAGMESLRTLYLGDARRITDDGLVHVGRLRSLERISLSHVGITDAGLAHLRELTSLTYLRIDSNRTITGEGLKHLAGLTRLKDLNIQLTGVGNEGLAHLKNFIVLEKLNLANTHVDDAGLAHLAQLPALKSLRLPDGITDQGLAHLHACAQLEELYLPAQSVTADGLRQLAHIPRLRILRLSKLHDGALAALSDLSSLEQIHLWASPFSQKTDHGPERISISDDGLAHLRGLSNLYSLDIQNSQRISDDGLAYLSDLPAIEELLLYNVPVGDAGIAHLAGLTSLTKLGLSTTKVTDAGLSHLAGLTSLKNLQLRRTSVTDEGMAELAGLTALEFLGLGETKVTEAGIAGLRGLPSLISISGLVERQLGNRGALRLKPGDPAPAFSIKTVDGECLRLEDFRGKVVLLDFWATWCGPCVAAMPKLQALYDEYSKDGRFTIIGLSLDDNVSTAKWFARDKGLSWPQGYAGRWSKSGVRSDYGIEGIPAYFLIGPDGTILANQSGGLSQIKTATEAALRPN